MQPVKICQSMNARRATHLASTKRYSGVSAEEEAEASALKRKLPPKGTVALALKRWHSTKRYSGISAEEEASTKRYSGLDTAAEARRMWKRLGKYNLRVFRLDS